MKYDYIKIKIEGITLPTPIDIEYSLEDLDADSDRDVISGVLDRNRIRSDMLKISISYSVNDTSSISTILKLISKEIFKVELFDFKEGKRVEKNMYSSSKTFQPLLVENVWIKGLKFKLIEV